MKKTETIKKYKERIILQSDAFTKYESTRAQVEFYVNKKGLKFSDPSILNYMHEDYITEIYDVDEVIQTYANKTFFSFSNYDILNLISKPFYQLFEREPEYTSQIFNHVLKAIQLKSTIKYEIDTHILTEIDHTDEGKYEVSLLYLSPLLSDCGEVVELISIGKCKKVQQNN